MKIRPFQALRPTPEAASKIASLPYDVMDTAEAKKMAEGNESCFLHVVRSEIDLPEDTAADSPAVYEQAKKALDALAEKGLMLQEGAPSLYLYRQQMPNLMSGSNSSEMFTQTAVVACCSIDDYASGKILRHENTRKDKEDDRTNHILVTRAQTGQVFLCYDDVPAIDALVNEESSHTPLYDFVSSDGIRHTVWRVENSVLLQKAFEVVPCTYIADGHHRSAASYRAGTELREKAKLENKYTPDAEYNFVMACLFPASQLHILPYNRCVKDLNGLTEEEFFKKAIECGFSIAAISGLDQLFDHSCAVYLPSGWYRLAWRLTDEQAADPVESLDCARLQADLLSPVLGIADPRTDSRIYFVGGIHGVGRLMDDVKEGRAAIAFAMNPTSIGQMQAVAAAGKTMPPKSTWFEPKLRSGLLVHKI